MLALWDAAGSGALLTLTTRFNNAAWLVICKLCVHGGCFFCMVDAASYPIEQALSFLLLPPKCPSKALKRGNTF